MAYDYKPLTFIDLPNFMHPRRHPYSIYMISCPHTHTCTQKAEELPTAKVALYLINADSVRAMCGEWIVGSKKVLNIHQVVC